MKITKIDTFPFPDFKSLKDESISEKYNFLIRLEKDWLENKNQFSKQGEALYQIYINNELIAIGGINIDPFQNDLSIGRLRRFYVKNAFRKQKIGSKLVHHILTEAKSHFKLINLKTESEIASKFYLSLGFKNVDNDENISHIYVYQNS